MIENDKYKEAKKIVKEFEEKMNATLCKDRVCCVCKEKNIKGIHVETLDPLKQENGMWSDGVVEKITFGYGSIHDMKTYYIAVCDDCIVELEKEGFATNMKEIVKTVIEFKN